MRLDEESVDSNSEQQQHDEGFLPTVKRKGRSAAPAARTRKATASSVAADRNVDAAGETELQAFAIELINVGLVDAFLCR